MPTPLHLPAGLPLPTPAPALPARHPPPRLWPDLDGLTRRQVAQLLADLVRRQHGPPQRTSQEGRGDEQR